VSQAPEDPRLDVAPVYADTPARQLVAIAHQIISIAQHGPRVRFKNIEMLLLGHCEGMMDEAPVLLLRIPLEHRKIDYPGKREQIRWGEIQPIPKVEP